MEGVLEKLDFHEKGVFKTAPWNKYYFVLHEEILMFTQLTQRSQILGKMHMAITKIQSDD